MKRKIFISIPLAALAVAVLFNSCKKDDTTPPVVTVSGSSSMTLSLNSSQPTDPGATANDDKDGSITDIKSDWSSTNPNMNLTGTYTITYSATDKAGNTGQATRTVVVKNDAAYLEGTYTDSVSSGSPLSLDTVISQTITASTTVNNKIYFTKLGAFSNNNLDAMVTGTDVAIVGQTKVGIGTSGCSHTFAPNGSGLQITQTSGKYRFSVKYTDVELTGGGGCPGYTALPTEDVLTQ